MRRPWIIGGLVVLVVAAIVWMAWPREDASQAGGHGHGRGGRGAGGPTPVAVAPVEKSDVRITRNALGTVTSYATVTVRTQIAGQLQEIDFKEGQLVNKGDLLAVVDPRPYQNALEQAQGQLMRDQALLKDAQINLERYQKLVSEDSIARQQLDTQRSLVKQYQGAVQTDQGQVNNAKLNLAYCHITAPVSGRVGLTQVDPGNYVQTNDANGIVVITQIQPIAVIFTLPEDDLATVNTKMNAGETLEVTAFDRTNSKQLATGKLTALDNQIDPSTGTFKLRAEFDNQDQMLFPNQFVNIVLLIDVLHDVNTVPSAAIQRGSQGTFVYQAEPDNTVKLRQVKTGAEDNGRIQIDSELNPGDQVVVDGTDKLKDGARITLPSSQGGEQGHGHRSPQADQTGTEPKEPSPANPPKDQNNQNEAPATPNAQGTPDNGAPSTSFVPPPENQPAPAQQDNQQNFHDWRKRHGQTQ